jgi:RNA polymerase sigma factor (TIGR02999 family)
MVDRSPSEPARQVAAILGDQRAGPRQRADELLPLLYDDLRRLAASRMARLVPGQTLQATALVHEAYVRLVGAADPGWEGRAHFFGAAARAMRNVVADHLQRKGTAKRGGAARRVGDATMAGLSCDGPNDDVLAVAEVLSALEREYPRHAEVVTLRFFGGLTCEEVAAVTGGSLRTVERDWQFARAWMNSRLAEHGDS